MIAGITILMLVMSIIGITRTVVMGNANKILEVYSSHQENSEQGFASSTLIEFGSTLKTVNIAMTLVPLIHTYWYGESYLNSLFVAVPNIIPGASRKSEGLDVWLTEMAFGDLSETHGRGGSISMEAYMNFGYAGVLVFLVVGAFLRFLYERFLEYPNFLRTVILFAAISGMSLWIRNTSTMFIRPFLWPIIIVLLTCKSGSNNINEQ